MVACDIEKYLQSTIQQRMIGGVSNEIFRYLNNDDVCRILPENAPQLYIDKAVLVNVNGGEESYNLVIANVPVTKSMCQGHFDWFPMVPLALAGQASAQVASLAALWVNDYLDSNDQTLIPLAIQVKNIKSISEKKSATERKDFAVPGDVLIVTAKYLGGRFGIHKAECNIYVNGTRIVNLQELDIILVSREDILSRGGRM